MPVRFEGEETDRLNGREERRPSVERLGRGLFSRDQADVSPRPSVKTE